MEHPEIKWQVNENALQSYRLINISSQSFLLAVGTLLLEKPWLAFALVSAIATAMIWIFWVPVVISRHRVTDYYKIAMDLDYSALEEFEKECSEQVYVEEPEKRNAANKKYDRFATNWRPTRIKLDGWLPILFTGLWAVLIVLKICEKRP